MERVFLFSLLLWTVLGVRDSRVCQSTVQHEDALQPYVESEPRPENPANQDPSEGVAFGPHQGPNLDRMDQGFVVKD